MQSCVCRIGFLQKVFQFLRRLLERSLNVKTPQLLTHVRRRFYLQLIRETLLRARGGCRRNSQSVRDDYGITAEAVATACGGSAAAGH